MRRRGRSRKDEAALEAGFDPHMVDAPLLPGSEEELEGTPWSVRDAVRKYKEIKEKADE